MVSRNDTSVLGLLGKGLLVLIGLLIALSLIATLVSITVGLVWTIITSVVPILIVAGLAYLALSWYFRGDDSGSVDRTSSPSKSPEQRLKERYVNGEISETEYERRLEQYLDPVDTETTSETDRLREFE